MYLILHLFFATRRHERFHSFLGKQVPHTVHKCVDEVGPTPGRLNFEPLSLKQLTTPAVLRMHISK